MGPQTRLTGERHMLPDRERLFHGASAGLLSPKWVSMLS